MKMQLIARNSRLAVHRLMHVVAALLLAISCHDEPQEVTGGETHFLMACDPLSTNCDPGTACVCGICTRSCAEAAMCGDLAASAVCIQSTERSDSSSCQDPSVPAYCDFRCTTDRDCARLSGSHYCANGFCRTHSATGSGGGASGGAKSSIAGAGMGASVGGSLAGSAGVSGAPAMAGAAGVGTTCAAQHVVGNEVLILGDAFIAQSHQITAYLEELAREAGKLGSGERFRDYSMTINNSLALGDTFIAQQYSKGQADGTSKVVVLCGGGADVLAGSCPSPLTADCPMLVAAAQAATQLLAQMAKDGLEDVVWFFYPNPVDSGLLAKMDLLRPMVQKACDSSPVPCHWIDLRTAFEGHYSDYIRPDGMTPTAVGSQVAAAAIWSVMQRDCVAQ